MRKYKWGILTAGKMSAKFVKALKLLNNAELFAVASRDAERARHFADELGFKKYYSNYEELASDPEVEIIYIASPHSHHFEHTMLCLRNRKAVLCEKAFSLNSREVEAMINESRQKGVFLMEALWPPFQPVYQKPGKYCSAVKRENLFTLMPDSDSRHLTILPTGNSTLN